MHKSVNIIFLHPESPSSSGGIASASPSGCIVLPSSCPRTVATQIAAVNMSVGNKYFITQKNSLQVYDRGSDK